MLGPPKPLETIVSGKRETCPWSAAILSLLKETVIPVSDQNGEPAARRAGDFAQAETVLRRSVDLARSLGERYLLGSCLPKLGNLFRDQADYERAAPLYCEALQAFRGIRENWWTARCLGYLAQTEIGLQDFLRAALVLGASDALLESCGGQRVPSERQPYDDAMEAARLALGDATFHATYDRGRQLQLDALASLLLEPDRATERRPAPFLSKK